MKTFIILLFSFSLSAQGSFSYQSNDKVHLWGHIEVEDLKDAPYKEWFQQSQKNYNEDIPGIAWNNLKDVKVKIFLGTWCGDTKNYLPKFLKLWEGIGMNEDQLELIALHNQDSLYKAGPNREEVAYNIHRVPTFIFFRENTEIGRIVEQPKNSLVTDIAQIALGVPSEHKYPSVAYLQSVLKTTHEDSLASIHDSLVKELMYQTEYVGELTTFAKKLTTEGKTAHGEFIYQLNTKLHKYHPYSHYRLGRFYYDQGHYEKSFMALKEAIMLDPQYKYAIDLMAEINDEM